CPESKGARREPEPLDRGQVLFRASRAHLATVRFGSSTGNVRCGATVLLDACWLAPTFALLIPPPPGASTTGFGFGRSGPEVVDGRRFTGSTGSFRPPSTD